MESIKKIRDSEEYKYYVPCNIPLIVKAVNRLGGLVYTDLLANDGLVAVPNFALSENKIPSSNVRFSQKLNQFNLLKELGIHKKYGYFDNFIDGLNYLNFMNKKGKDALLGVTSYYLPYSKDYLSSIYIDNYIDRTIGIVNHYVSVVNIDHEKIKLYDATENEHENWVRLKDLELAWRGDSQIEAFENFPNINELREFTYLEISLEKKITESNLTSISIELLKVIIEKCLSEERILENRITYFYGKSSLLEFLNYVKEYDFTNNKKNKSLSNSIIEMQISRYFLRDLIKDIAIIDKRFIEFSETISALTNEFTNNVYKFNFIISKKNVNREKILILCDEIYKIYCSEQNIYMELLLQC